MRALVSSAGASNEEVHEAVGRLARLGVADVSVVTGGGPAAVLAEFARGLSGRTVMLDARLLVADAALGQLVDDPAVRSGALLADAAPPVGSGNRPAGPPPGDGAASGATELEGSACAGSPPVRVAHRRITSAGSAVHEASGSSACFLGALVVDAAEAGRAASLLSAAADAADRGGWAADPIDLALVALVRGQVPMTAVPAVGPCIRVGSAGARDATARELAGLDQARVLLERANRPDDGFYSTFVLRRASKPVTALALRLGLTPNAISLFSLVVGLSAALSFAQGSWGWALVGALLLQASLIVDCVDGEVARFTRSFSELGAWLDASTDRVKEYAAYAGLAIGAARNGQDIWLLATAVMVLQTVRHIGDYDFSRVQRIRESWVPARDLEDPSDGGSAGTGATLELSAQLNRNSRVRWAKKVLHMPIGERWLVLSVGAVTVGPSWTLWIMLALGLLALAYTTLGRILRAGRWDHPAERSGSWLLAPQLDLGPIGSPLWAATAGRRNVLAAPFGWAWPAGMRVVEFAVVGGLTAWLVPASAGVLFGWVFVMAFHHYDTLYRALGGSAPPRWLVWCGLGWEGRTILVAIAAGVGGSALTGLLTWGTPPLAVLFVVVASAQFVRSMRSQEVVDA